MLSSSSIFTESKKALDTVEATVTGKDGKKREVFFIHADLYIRADK